MDVGQFLNPGTTDVQNSGLEQAMGSLVGLSLGGIVIVLILVFIFWYVKENIKARIRGEKTKSVIEWYMTKKKESEINDINKSL